MAPGGGVQPAKFYDANAIVIYFAGITISGFADGEFYSIEATADAFDWVVGTDGEVAWSKTNDRRAIVTLKLLQTSIANAALSTIINTDRDAPNGAGVGSFLMQDLQGGTIVQAAQARIMRHPDASLDRTAKPREWKIGLARATRVEGGN